MPSPMPDWLEPMAATRTQNRFTGPEWWFERKIGGIRLLAYKRAADVRLYSRNRLPQHLPTLAAAIAALPADELVCRRWASAGLITEITSTGGARHRDRADAAYPPQLAFSFHLLADRVHASLARERLVAAVSGTFGAIGLLLAVTGVYGVTAYAAARRGPEIGIWRALGASAAEVIGTVVRPVLIRTAVGFVIGLSGAALVARYLEAMLFGLTPLDPATYVVVAVILILAVAIATYLPARRAVQVDPLTALRYE